MEFRTVAGALGVLLVFVYAIGSSLWVSNSPGWYSSLNRPPWQPPDFVFGLIWPYNFIVLGIAAIKVSQNLQPKLATLWIVIFAASIVAALNWAHQFYVPHNLQASTISLGIAALVTIPLLILTFRASLIVGALLVPYQAWVIIATTLAWGYSTRN